MEIIKFLIYKMCKKWMPKSSLHAKTPIHIAEERENRYVANHDTIGRTPVTNKATAEVIAQPRYKDDA